MCPVSASVVFLNSYVDMNICNVGGFGIYFGVNLSIAYLCQEPGLLK